MIIISIKVPKFVNQSYLTININNMQFNNLELSAVLKVGFCMANADGKLEQDEMKVLAVGMAEFGVDEQHFQLLSTLADAMSPATMLATLAALNESQKKFVCGFLATIMISDGDIDDSEVKLWLLTFSLCGFPTMSIAEAADYWRTH